MPRRLSTSACVLLVALLAADSEKGTFWELPDKADLRVVTDPWPATAGSSKLKAEITTNDDDQKFTGTLEYRISSSEQSSGAWKLIPKTRADNSGSAYFETAITLAKGTCFIQFRVRAPGKQSLEQTDWKVDVK